MPARTSAARWLLCVPAAMALFCIAHKGAFEGYFSGDDLDNIGWTRLVPAVGFFAELVSPFYSKAHFRPPGHALYGLLGNSAGLDFRWYVAATFALHWINTLLVVWVGAKLGLSLRARLAAGLLFVFHMGLFEAIWRPMFLFDLLCSAFVLLCLRGYFARRYAVSFAMFWLAYKSKEHAVMIPAVLLLYEWLLGQRRWKPLLPFFLVSACFGLQAALSNTEVGGDYRLRLAVGSLARIAGYYAARIFVFWWMAPVVAVAAWLARDKRVAFGLGAAALLILPMLALPDRASPAYLYAGAAVLSIGMGAFAEIVTPRYLALFFAIWLPANYLVLREKRKEVIARGHENRAYVEQLRHFSQLSVKRYVFDARPPDLPLYGIHGAIRFLTGREDAEVVSADGQNLRNLFHDQETALLLWDNTQRKLTTLVRRSEMEDRSYLEINRESPVWQLGEGWFQLEGHYRWITTSATAWLRRPPGAREFELQILAGPDLMKALGRVDIEVRLNKTRIGTAVLTRSGIERRTFPLTDSGAGETLIEFRVSPGFRTPEPGGRLLGIAIKGFGFLSKESQ